LAGKRRATNKRDEFAPLHLTLKLLLDCGGPMSAHDCILTHRVFLGMFAFAPLSGA
jgi:hypothetical protein